MADEAVRIEAATGHGAEAGAGDARLFDVGLRAPPSIAQDGGAPRLMVSFEPTEAALIPAPDQGMRPHALIPRLPWRPPTGAECARLSRPPLDAANWAATIAIVAIDPGLIADYHHALGGLGGVEETYAALGRPDLVALEARLSRHIIESFAASTERYHRLGPSVDTPGRLSTTIDRKRGFYTGLHVDSWDRLPSLERHRARNRISVNLGRGPRWLEFGATTFGSIARIMGSAPHEPYRIIQEFFQRHPQQPVFRVRLAPGEAYIAPTENIVHDGYTVGNPHLDISFNVLGDFVAGE